MKVGYYKHHRIEGTLITVWSWAKNKLSSDSMPVFYLSIWISLYGFVEDDDIEAWIAGQKFVKVKIHYRKGGEDTNPEHLLVQHDECNPAFTTDHSKYNVLAQGHCSHNEVVAGDYLLSEIPLSLEVNQVGSIDSLSEDPDYGLGVFLLGMHKHIPGASDFSACFLELICEERYKPKIKQRATARSYFPSPYADGSGSGSDMRVG